MLRLSFLPFIIRCDSTLLHCCVADRRHYLTHSVMTAMLELARVVVSKD